MTGAAQALALYWRLLSSYRSQDGWGGKQCLTHPWTHPHQPKQVHCVGPLSYGEDHLREAQCGARGSDSLNLSTPLLLSLHFAAHWKVNISFSLTFFYCYCWWFAPVCMEVVMRFILADHIRIPLYILREEIPSIGRLEAQLKACLCRLVFSKAKVRTALRRQILSITAFVWIPGTD